jgi:hypothetical protein
MSKVLVLLVTAGLFFSMQLHAQDEKMDTAMISRIREEGLQHSQVAFLAHQLTDVNGPRLTNSPGFHRAATWVVLTLTGWGLTNAKKESWGEFGYGWSAEKTYLAMRTPYYSPMIAYAMPWSGSTNGPVSAPAILLEKTDPAYIAANAGKIKGHIVLLRAEDSVLSSNFEADAQRYTDSNLVAIGDMHILNRSMILAYIADVLNKANANKRLQAAGALAVLKEGEEGRDGTVTVEKIIGYRKIDQPAVPELVVAKESYLSLMRLLENSHEVVLDLQSETKLSTDDLQGHNVIAEIPGTDPKLKAEVVMLGGHLDSWTGATGATDNAAGCIAAMEAVRILKTLMIKPKRTIRIALWDGEEEGLYGSFNYVKNHFGDPADMKLKPEQEKVSAYYNLDNGSGKIRGIFAQGNEKVAPIFKKWLSAFTDLGATTVTLHNTGSTDHLAFDAVGIPGFQFIQDPMDYDSRAHHTNMDDYSHLQLDDLRQAATILAAFVYNTAMRPEKLPRKALPKPEKFLFEDFLP